MLMYNALATPCFRSIKLRARKPTCPTCGTASRSERRTTYETDYVAFCGGPRPDWVGRGMVDADDTNRRISAKVCRWFYTVPLSLTVFPTLCPQNLKDALSTSRKKVRIIDVRPPTEFGICHLQGSISKSPDQLSLTTLLCNHACHRRFTQGTRCGPKSCRFC